MNAPEPETAIMRHADHAPDVICHPAGRGLCEPLTVRLVTGPLDDEDRYLLREEAAE